MKVQTKPVDLKLKVRPFIEGDFIEFLIEHPEHLAFYHEEVRYKDIYKILMFRPEYHFYFQVEKMSKYSWEMILSEQPQMINLYIKKFMEILPEEEVYAKVEEFKQMFEDIEYYL